MINSCFVVRYVFFKSVERSCNRDQLDLRTKAWLASVFRMATFSLQVISIVLLLEKRKIVTSSFGASKKGFFHTLRKRVVTKLLYCDDMRVLQGKLKEHIHILN